MKKYKLIEDNEIGKFLGKTMYRVQYLIDIPMYGVKAGDFGGWIEKEENLSHEGNCCVLDDAKVMDNGIVEDNACASATSIIRENGKIKDNSLLLDFAVVEGNGQLLDDAVLCDYATVDKNGTLNKEMVVGTEGRIKSFNDIIFIPSSADEESITLYRTLDNKVNISYANLRGDFTFLEKKIHDVLNLIGLTEKRLQNTINKK